MHRHHRGAEQVLAGRGPTAKDIHQNLRKLMDFQSSAKVEVLCEELTLMHGTSTNLLRRTFTSAEAGVAGCRRR